MLLVQDLFFHFIKNAENDLLSSMNVGENINMLPSSWKFLELKHVILLLIAYSSGASVHWPLLTEDTLIYYLHICSHIHSILQYWAGCIILQIVQSADSSHLSAASCKSRKWTTGLLVVHVCSWNILCAQNRRQILSLKIAHPLSWCFFFPLKN